MLTSCAIRVGKKSRHPIQQSSPVHDPVHNPVQRLDTTSIIVVTFAHLHRQSVSYYTFYTVFQPISELLCCLLLLSQSVSITLSHTFSQSCFALLLSQSVTVGYTFAYLLSVSVSYFTYCMVDSLFQPISELLHFFRTCRKKNCLAS